MVSTIDSSSSHDASNGTKIVLGDDFKTESKGTGRIDLDHGSFNNVLYVAGLVANLLLSDQMTHTRSPKKVVFTPNDFEITEISNGRSIEKGFVDHSSKMYKFSHSVPF